MATLRSYVERIPLIYQNRYKATYWIGWANALLERMSGKGILPPQRLVRGVTVFDGCWINKPSMCRDVLEISCPKRRGFTFRFEEENNKLRLLDVEIPLPRRLVLDLHQVEQNADRILFRNEGLAEGSLNGYLFVVTAGLLAGAQYTVESSGITGDGVNIYTKFVGVPDWEWSPVVGGATLPIVQAAFSAGSEGDTIISGYFVAPGEHLMLSYIAPYKPINWVDDDIGIGEHDNLIESWLRWKVEEHVSAVSEACVYWMGRVREELAQLQTEMFNRINKPRGRRLIGFER